MRQVIKKLTYNQDTLAANLRALRARKNVSREKAAGAIGINSYSLRGYEQAKTSPNLSAAVALANYYGVTVEDLIKE